MIWNEHLTKDERGNYLCSYCKACVDCEHYNDCPCLDQIRAENNRRFEDQSSGETPT